MLRRFRAYDIVIGQVRLLLRAPGMSAVPTCQHTAGQHRDHIVYAELYTPGIYLFHNRKLVHFRPLHLFHPHPPPSPLATTSVIPGLMSLFLVSFLRLFCLSGPTH